MPKLPDPAAPLKSLKESIEGIVKQASEGLDALNDLTGTFDKSIKEIGKKRLGPKSPGTDV